MSGRTKKVILTPQSQVLRRLRQRRGLSMREAGLLMGYSNSYISQVENGRENHPKGKRLERFLKAYKTHPNTYYDMVRKYEPTVTDKDIVEILLPKLKPEHVKLLRSMAEQMANGSF